MDLTMFLKEPVDTINNLIKSLSSAETTTDTNTNTTDTTTTPAANENSSSEQGTSTGKNLADKSDREDGSKKGKDDSRSDTQQLEKLRNNLNQIKESLIQLQKFEESDLAKQLQTHLRNLEAKFGTVRDKNEQTLSPTPNAPSSRPKVPLSDYLTFINKELMKIKYQIPSIRKLSMTSSKAHSRASSGSNEGSSVQELPKLHKSERFPKSSFYIEIEGIFGGLKKDEEKFILSCFAVLTEGAVVKRRLLTYWGIGEGCLKDSKSETPEEIVDRILLKFKEMGLIEPAMNKRKQEVRSYKMDPLVRSALNKIFQEKNMFDYDPNGNVEENSAPNNKAFLVKDEGKASDDKSRSQQGDQPNLDPEKLFTLFNVNEHSPDAKLIHLVRKKSKDMNVVDWLSKMKSLKVLYLGRWQKSASYHIEVKSTEFLKGLKSMEELKFLSLQGISRIKEIPRSIVMLTNLVVLDLKDCYNLELLPEEISSLTKLRYLDISNCYLLGNMPKELSLLTELQVLKGFIIGHSKTRNLGTLEDLKKLHKLKKLTIIATRNEFPTPTDLGALQELKALQKLTIAWGVQPKIAQEPEKAHKSSKREKPTESSVLKLDELKKLDLQCFPYSTPSWLKPGDLPKLEKLYIRGGNFTTLEKGTWEVKALRLKYLSGMKTNWRELKELFPKLAYLERVKCPGITLCPCDENGVWQKSKT
ncbi:uncharacterized protein LOC112031831 [Quercus suber]|uniref:Disease resistance rpp13-like protein 4 n=1 Tax=Quercus suber TaxID=58331 RepID=A0AAW0KCY1_QUESU